MKAAIKSWLSDNGYEDKSVDNSQEVGGTLSEVVEECIADIKAKIEADAINLVLEQGYEFSIEMGEWDSAWVINIKDIENYRDKLQMKTSS